jgi:hypothetical protein
MARHKLLLSLLPGTFAVCRFYPDAPLPAWVTAGPFVSTTRTADELSVVCLQDVVPPGVRCERDWCCLRVAGPLDFALIGVLVSLAAPLAEAGVSVFAVSTFDTDYLLVRGPELPRAVEALRSAGHVVEAGG